MGDSLKVNINIIWSNKTHRKFTSRIKILNDAHQI